MKRALSRKNLWARTPPFVKRGAGRLLSGLPPSLVLGRAFRSELRRLQESQHWPAERIREHQLLQLRTICLLAAEKTAYYREVFREAGFRPQHLKAPQDLVAIPTIDRSTVADHLAERRGPRMGPDGLCPERGPRQGP